MTMKSFLAIIMTFALTSLVFAEDFFNPAPMSQLNNFSNSHVSNDIKSSSKQTSSSNTSFDIYKKQNKFLNTKMQSLEDQDRELDRLQKYYAQSGDIPQAAETGLKRIQLRNTYQNLQGLQAITNFDMGDNVSLSNAMSRATGRQIGIQPLTNGNFNLVVSGQPLRQNISRADLRDMAQTMLKLP